MLYHRVIQLANNLASRQTRPFAGFHHQYGHFCGRLTIMDELGVFGRAHHCATIIRTCKFMPNVCGARPPSLLSQLVSTEYVSRPVRMSRRLIRQVDPEIRARLNSAPARTSAVPRLRLGTIIAPPFTRSRTYSRAYVRRGYASPSVLSRTAPSPRRIDSAGGHSTSRLCSPSRRSS
ncbi:hypothetical protein BV20DRAFT_792374 [Pilatotrama ljubarskyi]|nr:hypothetical protein BV20DRAFT_792374 [Pilatotrama ljubarskyi]